MVLNMSANTGDRVDGETKYDPISLRGFSLLENLLINPSGMKTSWWEWGASEVASCAKVPAVVSGGSGVGELEPLDGVTGDGVGSVPLSFKATRKLWHSGPLTQGFEACCVCPVGALCTLMRSDWTL